LSFAAGHYWHFDPTVAAGLLSDAAAEVVTLDKWFVPFADPVRSLPNIGAHQHPHFGFVKADPFGETISPDKWFSPFADPPVLAKLGLRAASQQVSVTDPVSLTEPETVSIDRWMMPLSEPVRLDLRAHLAGARQQVSPENPFGLTQAESVTEDRWHQPWSEPVRFLPRLEVGSQLAFAISPEGLASEESATIDRFLLPWSEPVRFKPGLHAAHQMAFIPNPWSLLLRRPTARGYVVI
jgi:hypothetical protein